MGRLKGLILKPTFLIISFIAFFPTSTTALRTEIDSIFLMSTKLGKRIVVPPRVKILATNNDVKEENEERFEWDELIKEIHGTAAVKVNGSIVNEFDVYKEFYKDLYHLVEENNPGHGSVFMSRYFAILKFEMIDLDRRKSAALIEYKRAGEILNEAIKKSNQKFDNEEVRMDRIREAKHHFDIIVFGEGGILWTYGERRYSIAGWRAMEVHQMFEDFEIHLEAEELFEYYNSRWESEYGYGKNDDMLFGVHLQPSKRTPLFNLPYDLSEFNY